MAICPLTKGKALGKTMASYQLLSYILLTFLLLLFTCSSYAASSADDIRVSSSDSQKVNLNVYYETLCPYCANFIVNHLVKVFDRELISIVDLRLVPWGNTFIRPDRTIICQHGEDECFLNTIDACAIDVWPDLNKHFNLIYCIERKALEGMHNQWKTCFEKLGLPYEPVLDCIRRGRGMQLELQYADETARLNPPHVYVPWVVVNNKPLLEDYQNFITYVCNAHKGPSVPKVCKSASSVFMSSENANPTHQVCYPGDLRNITSSMPEKRIQGQQKHERSG